jgi:ABC-type transporter lipoprotein component MlaA
MKGNKIILCILFVLLLIYYINNFVLEGYENNYKPTSSLTRSMEIRMNSINLQMHRFNKFLDNYIYKPLNNKIKYYSRRYL